jgi:archaellum biogenesis ATPase FlaH
MSIKLVTLLEELINELPNVSVPNAFNEYKELKKASIGKRLAMSLEGDGKAVQELMEQYRSIDHIGGKSRIDYSHIRLDEALDEIDASRLIRVGPKSLNDRLDGGLVPGCQTAIYAPTEVGKTLIAINMCATMLKDGRKVLYCGNEDSRQMMLRRFYSRMSGMNKHQMQDNRELAIKKAYDNGIGNLLFAALDPGTIHDIEAAIKQHNPEVVFVDQMANLMCGKQFSKVEKCEHLAAELRSLAQRYGVANVIVHQASDSANGKLILDKSDMYFSNVGIQGQMDVMLGIGMDEVFHDNHQRMLCLTKNKLSGNHSSWPVIVQEDLSLVRDI